MAAGSSGSKRKYVMISVVAERVHLNVDYDSKREFDASNNIQLYYEGKRNELIPAIEQVSDRFQG